MASYRLLNKTLSGLRANSRSESRLSTIRSASSGVGMLPEDVFTSLLFLERKRTERSGRRFVLLLLDPGRLITAAHREQVLPKLLDAVAERTRDTDLKGWYKQGSVIGVIFTEVGNGEDRSVVHALSNKLIDALYNALSISEINEIHLSFHVFPEDWGNDNPDGPTSSTLRLALGADRNRHKAALGIKRLVDIAGSLAAIIVFLPLSLVIALAVRLTSKGPVLFRQVRLGQYGKKFTFLKFRSMYVNNDHSIHEQYVKRFIVGSAGTECSTATQQKVYKLTADPRVTPVGEFLRKTSLDELPQFLNVLAGDMSLVGPRPPVMYEVQSYGLWHRERLTAVKPGITGLWQVEGRSRVTFDEMVRLDIRYARSWSLWLDFKILIQTPGAVISGIGAC